MQQERNPERPVDIQQESLACTNYTMVSGRKRPTGRFGNAWVNGRNRCTQVIDFAMPNDSSGS